MSNLRMVGALLVLAGVAGLTAETPFSAGSGSVELPPTLSHAASSREAAFPASAETRGSGSELATVQDRILADAEPEGWSGGDEWRETANWYEVDEEDED